MLNTIAIKNYRSIRELIIPLTSLNVVTGANGAGKSNLYRALRLLAETAVGRAVSSLVEEGGLDSCLWAGPEKVARARDQVVEGQVRRSSVSLQLGFSADEGGYLLDFGLPEPVPRTQFGLDPEIKREAIFHSAFYESKSALVERNGPSLRARDDSGRWQHLDQHLPHYESLLSHFGDPMRLPEALHLREWIRTWRFYDQFRTDRDAPVRKPQVATRTLVLNHDGRDLAAAWQTILEVGDDEALAACLDDAFPGARVEIRKVQGSFELLFHQPGLLRPLTLAELSDGTLRYLLWIAALLSPRAAGLMVLNEPENSLHPQLLPPLARLLLLASERSQVWVISHAERLVRTLVDSENCQHVGLVKEQGATRWQDDGLDTTPAWRWLKR
ncbi:MAG: AAA family ATPase [Gammaproteobacteria bacterium]|jgi:predicted ATPase